MLEDGLISKKLFFFLFFLRFSTSDFKFNGHIAERYDIVRSDDLKDNKIILVKTSHGGRLSGFVENLSMFVPAGRGSLV